MKDALKFSALFVAPMLFLLVLILLCSCELVADRAYRYITAPKEIDTLFVEDTCKGPNHDCNDTTKGNPHGDEGG